MKKTLIVAALVSAVSLHAAVETPTLIHDGYDAGSDFTIVAKLNMTVFKACVKAGSPGCADTLIVGRTSGENKQTGVSTIYTSTSLYWDVISSSFLTGAWDHSTYCMFGDSNWTWTGKPENWDKDMSDIPWDDVAEGAFVYTWNATRGSATYGTTVGLVLVDSVGRMIVEGFTRNSGLISSGNSLKGLEFGDSLAGDGILYYADSLKSRAAAEDAARLAMSIPEPSSLGVIVGIGVLAFARIARRRRKSDSQSAD